MDLINIYAITGSLMFVVGLILLLVTPKGQPVVISGMTMVTIVGVAMLFASVSMKLKEFNATHITQCTITLIQENGNDN